LNILSQRISILWKRYNPRNGWLWMLSFSGGKDSSLLVAAITEFFKEKNGSLEGLLVIHEDTSVEIPFVRMLVEQTLKEIKGMGAETITLKADENFFTLMLKRGYGFPKWNYRWCCRVYKYGKIKKFISELPHTNVLNLIAIRGDEKFRVGGKWIQEAKLREKNVVTASPLIDLNINDVWSILESKYESIYRRLRKVYVAKPDGLGCWTCTVIKEDLATLLLDPRLYELKIELCRARCAGLECFINTLKTAVKERPDAFPGFRWPEEFRDIKCRRKCSTCSISRWRSKKVPKYLVLPCWERGDMLHVVFTRAEDGLTAAERLSVAEIHYGGRILCVPKSLMRFFEREL